MYEIVKEQNAYKRATSWGSSFLGKPQWEISMWRHQVNYPKEMLSVVTTTCSRRDSLHFSKKKKIPSVVWPDFPCVKPVTFGLKPLVMLQRMTPHPCPYEQH